jgi:hypothetical protein
MGVLIRHPVAVTPHNKLLHHGPRQYLIAALRVNGGSSCKATRLKATRLKIAVSIIGHIAATTFLRACGTCAGDQYLDSIKQN